MDRKEQLMKWYESAKRDLPWRKTKDPYRIWISEIMLQQTRVAAVIPYYERFLEELPSVKDLSEVEEDRLMKLWQGLGYYSRARNLKRAAVEIVERYSGRLPETYRELLSLPGIGPYTAAAIASIAFSEPVPAVDGNVLRVLARLNDDERDIADPRTKEAVFRQLSESMPDDAGTFNQAMMELGATVCVPNGAPLCEHCPLKENCLARKNGTIGERPVKTKKAKREAERKTVFVLKNGERYLIRKRPDKGLLAGLYELPNTEGFLTQKETETFLSRLGVRPVGTIAKYERVHIFTHREWHMQVYAVEIAEADPAEYIWYDGTQSLPTAFAVCLS